MIKLSDFTVTRPVDATCTGALAAAEDAAGALALELLCATGV